MLKTLQAKDRHEIRHNRRRSGKSPEQGYVVARLALKHNQVAGWDEHVEFAYASNQFFDTGRAIPGVDTPVDIDHPRLDDLLDQRRVDRDVRAKAAAVAPPIQCGDPVQPVPNRCQASGTVRAEQVKAAPVAEVLEDRLEARYAHDCGRRTRYAFRQCRAATVRCAAINPSRTSACQSAGGRSF